MRRCPYPICLSLSSSSALEVLSDVYHLLDKRASRHAVIPRIIRVVHKRVRSGPPTPAVFTLSCKVDEVVVGDNLHIAQLFEHVSTISVQGHEREVP